MRYMPYVTEITSIGSIPLGLVTLLVILLVKLLVRGYACCFRTCQCMSG